MQVLIKIHVITILCKWVYRPKPGWYLQLETGNRFKQSKYRKPVGNPDTTTTYILTSQP